MITPKKREKILSEVRERLTAGINLNDHLWPYIVF